MEAILETSWFQWALSLAGLIVLTIVASYVVARVRTKSADDDFGADDMLTNFRELHVQGKISDEEYRNIKTKLAARIRGAIKDADNKG